MGKADRRAGLPVPPGSADESTRAEKAIDEALSESFPASDAPPWTLGLDPRSIYSVASEEPVATKSSKRTRAIRNLA